MSGATYFPPTRFKPTFQHRAGARTIAAMVTTMLFGVALFMLIRYFFAHARNDPLRTKALICALGVLAALEVLFTNHWLYQYFVLYNKAEEKRDIIPFCLPGKTACIILTAFLSQLFYASRIWKVGSIFDSPFRYAVFAIIALAVLQLGGGLIQVVVMAQMETLSAFNATDSALRLFQISMYITGIASAACDILIAASLVIILRSTGVDGTRRTKTLLEKLALYAINRGIFTSVLAVLSILLYDFASGTSYYLIPFTANTHVYLISVISMLATREGLRADMDRSFHVSDLILTTHKSRGAGTQQSSTNVLNGTELKELPGEAAKEGPSNC